MQEVMKRLAEIGIVPVIKIADTQKAAAVARALVKGGIACAEITFRTAQAEEAMARISREVPEILLGAGTVVSCEQVDRAVRAGAKFIVSPGLNPDVIRHCQALQVPVIPGVATPTEMEQAMGLGLTHLKLFPAECSGGVGTIKAVTAAYPDLRFMPTGGIHLKNINDYLACDKVFACGGSWMTPEQAVADDNFAEIERLAAEAMRTMLDCKLLHIGVNTPGAEDAKRIAMLFCSVFGLTYQAGVHSDFAGDMVEVMKGPGLGACGHIAVQVRDLERAVAYFNRMGYPLDAQTAKYDADGNWIAIYFAQDFGGFAVHLVQRKRD